MYCTACRWTSEHTGGLQAREYNLAGLRTNTKFAGGNLEEGKNIGAISNRVLIVWRIMTQNGD